MADSPEPERTDPTDEVGDEGGGSGDVQIEHTSVTTGSESTSTVVSRDTRVKERESPQPTKGLADELGRTVL